MRLELASRRQVKVGLTPLIDVVFILLLFFMLTTQFSKRQAMRIELPTTNAIAISSQTSDKLQLTLLSDGGVTVNGLVTIDGSEFETYSAIVNSLRQGDVVIVRTEDRVTLQSFTLFIDRLAAIGFDQVDIRILQ